jgi:hypothetical protein
MTSVSESSGMMFVHSALAALCPHIEWALSRVLGEPVSLQWEPQPLGEGRFRTEFCWHGPAGTGARLASTLHGWDALCFEVTEDPGPGHDGDRWMHTPDLGIFHVQTDSAGNTVVPEDRIRQALETAGTNPFELQREFRLVLGSAWDEELEPFRRAGDDSPVIWLHRVG